MGLFDQINIADEVRPYHIRIYTNMGPLAWAAIKDPTELDYPIFQYMYNHDKEKLDKDKFNYDRLTEKQKTRFHKTYKWFYGLDFEKDNVFLEEGYEGEVNPDAYWGCE